MYIRYIYSRTSAMHLKTNCVAMRMISQTLAQPAAAKVSSEEVDRAMLMIRCQPTLTARNYVSDGVLREIDDGDIQTALSGCCALRSDSIRWAIRAGRFRAAAPRLSRSIASRWCAKGRRMDKCFEASARQYAQILPSAECGPIAERRSSAEASRTAPSVTVSGRSSGHEHQLLFEMVSAASIYHYCHCGFRLAVAPSCLEPSDIPRCRREFSSFSLRRHSHRRPSWSAEASSSLQFPLPTTRSWSALTLHPPRAGRGTSHRSRALSR